MNKHLIIVPLILASGISLHWLSYQVEEPPEFVQSPQPTKIVKVENEDKEIKISETEKNVKVEITDKEKKNSNSKSEIVVEVKKEDEDIKNKKDPKEIKPEVEKKVEVTKKETKKTTKVEIKTKNVEAKVTKIKEKEPEPILVASSLRNVSLIVPKPENEIIKEARVLGGRVDPFLSLYPPDLPEIPDIKPVFPSNRVNRSNRITTPPNINSKNNDPFEDDIFDNTENKDDDIPDFGNIDDENGESKKTDPAIMLDGNQEIASGIVLTGIITGSRPLAILSIDGESKVLSIGKIIREDIQLKIVTIDYDGQSITVADNNNNRARLRIEDGN